MFPVHLKRMYTLLLWGKMLWLILIKSFWPNVSFKAMVSLLTFYLVDPSIDVSGVLKALTITVDIFLYVHQLLLYVFWCSHIGCLEVYDSYIFSLELSTYYEMSYFVYCYKLCFNVYFVWYKYFYPSFKNFSWSICFYTFTLCVFRSEVDLL